MTVVRVSRCRHSWLYGLWFAVWLSTLAFPAFAGESEATPSEPDPFPLLKEEGLGTLQLGLTEKQVKARIPCKLHKGKEEFWAGSGDFVQEWRYPDCGIALNMSSSQRGRAKIVMSITIQAPSLLKTSRGIGIGSTEQEVAAAYGQDQDKEMSESGRSFVAGSIYGGVVFTFENGRVTKIFLGAGAE